jgi:MFS family permease
MHVFCAKHLILTGQSRLLSGLVFELDGHVGYRWSMLAVVYLCMLSFALVFQSVPPILTLVRQELDVSHAQAGLLMSLFALPGIFVAIPGGILSDRLGARRTGVAALVLMAVGTAILGTSSSLVQAYAGRIVSGVGGLTLAVVLPQLLSKWFARKELGLGMGVYNTAMPLGTILSLNVFGMLGESHSWRVSIAITTAVSTIALLVFLLFYREPDEEAGKAGFGLAVADATGSGASIWLVGICWMWFNAALISFVTFSSDFLVSRGYGIGHASSISSLVMLGSLALSPIVGYIVHKYGKESVFIGTGGFLLAVLVYYVPASSLLVPLFVLAGVAASLVPAPIYSLPARIVRPQDLGLAFGIMTACLNVGVLAGPYLVGLVRDCTGDYVLGFHLMAVFALLLTSTIGLFSLLRPRGKRAGRRTVLGL